MPVPYLLSSIGTYIFKKVHMLPSPHSQYRIESIAPLGGRLLPASNCNRLYGDRSLAVAVAVKSVTDPSCQEVWVVHVPTGEIVFRTTGMGHAA